MSPDKTAALIMLTGGFPVQPVFVRGKAEQGFPYRQKPSAFSLAGIQPISLRCALHRHPPQICGGCKGWKMAGQIDMHDALLFLAAGGSATGLSATGAWNVFRR